MQMTRKAWQQIALKAQQLAVQGHKVNAIKFLREQTGCGIKEAYDAVKMLLVLHAGKQVRNELHRIFNPPQCVCGVIMRTAEDARKHMSEHPDWKLQ